MSRLLASLLLLLALPIANAQLSDAGQLLDRIVAIVNDGVVLQSELDQQLIAIRRGLTAQGVALPPEGILQAQVLETLVVKQIQLQRAERLELSVSDEELNRTLAAIAERNGITLSQLPAALASEGIDYVQYREDARTEMVLEQLRIRDVAGRVTISRGEVEQLLEQDSANSNIEYEVNHLLIAVDSDASNEEIAQGQQKAQELADRIRNGDDFGPIAVTYSDVPGVVGDRGYLGWRRADALPSQFAQDVTRMRAGEVSAPIRSGSGFHVVQVQNVRGGEGRVIINQRLARHILIQPTAVISEDDARSRLDNLRTRILNGEEFGPLAETESDDPGTAQRGGDLGWANPGTFVPEFEDTLDNLQPGEISEPFRTQFGWHIVQLMDTRDHDSTDTVRRNRAAAALRARKIEEESQKWLRQLRDEAYVELRLGDSGGS